MVTFWPGYTWLGLALTEILVGKYAIALNGADLTPLATAYTSTGPYTGPNVNVYRATTYVELGFCTRPSAVSSSPLVAENPSVRPSGVLDETEPR
jgi:hypothetical protein